MHNYHSSVDRELEPLVARLRSRYPGVRIVEARLRERSSDGELQQSIRYQAPLETLKACGLVTPDMLERRPFNKKSLARAGETPLGDGFFLSEGLDARSAPGHWDLSVSTGLTPRERPRISTREAQKLLRNFRKNATSLAR